MFDGNGNWTSDFSAQADRDNGIKILASRFDNIFIADIKESFENCLTKDGQIAPIGNFNMGGQKITNLNAGVNDNDAVNKSQIDNLSDNLQTQINTKANSSSVVNLTGTQTISGQKTFSSVAYGIASDANNSLLTTVSKNKAKNGYYKLGNGMIIQWGTISTGDDSGTVTFPTPFSNINYSIVIKYEYNGSISSSYGHDNAYKLSSTQFKWFRQRNVQLCWIAIGY